MRTLVLIIALALQSPMLYAGSVTCDSPGSLVQQERLRTQSIQAWAAFMDTRACIVADGTEQVQVHPGGVNGGPLWADGQEVLCLTSNRWPGCRYARWEAVWLPK